MRPQLILLLSVIMIFGCHNQTKTPAPGNKETTSDTFHLIINNDFWKGILFYSPVKAAGSVLSLDSVSTIATNSKSLNNILVNRDEENFIFPIITSPEHQSLDSVMQSWVSRDYSSNMNTIIIQDVNFDGFDDLLLHNRLYSGATNRFYDIWVYNSKTGDYNLWHLSKRLGLWEVDTANKILVFGLKTGPDKTIERHQVIRDTITRLID